MPGYLSQSTYVYSKLRKNFGRQTLFQKVPAHIIDSILPKKEEQNQYILRNPMNREVQATMPQTEHDTNTKVLVSHDQGINHKEGGWPREVHLYNEDHLIRHRRRVMHEDNYVNTVLSLSPLMKHYIKQNNAIDMYATYFDGMPSQMPVEKYNIRIANTFRDSSCRPVSCIVWTSEEKTKLAVAYSHKNYPPNTNENILHTCFLWDIMRQTAPMHEIKPERSCWQLACSPDNANVLITGLDNGIVNLFDIRKGSRAISSSSIYNSHYTPVTSLLYTHSRTNTEFFTGSSDGQCLWWDIRKLSEPIDKLCMSLKVPQGQNPSLNNAEGVSCLEFERNLPTKFLCGTESGLVINVNRMGKTHSEILASHWEAHSGPVRAVHRSPCTSRMFLTCGDFSVRVWSEEVRTAPIIVTKLYRYEVTDVAWAPLRYSSYMVACANGSFYYWDFLRKYREPVASLQVSKHGLTKITPHCDGQYIATGDSIGALQLLRISDNLSLPGEHDKQLMFQTYTRETKREHILDMRMKEIRLKLQAEEETLIMSDKESISEDEQERAVEEEYFKKVKEELRQTGAVSDKSDISIM